MRRPRGRSGRAEPRPGGRSPPRLRAHGRPRGGRPHHGRRHGVRRGPGQREAAPYFAAAFAAADVRTVGFMPWSRTLRHAVEAMRPMRSVAGASSRDARRSYRCSHAAGGVAHLTQRLASLTGAEPAFLRVPGVVASSAIREALLRADPHARRRRCACSTTLDLALLSPSVRAGSSPRSAPAITTSPTSSSSWRGAPVPWGRCACGSSVPTGRPGAHVARRPGRRRDRRAAAAGALPVGGRRGARQVRRRVRAALVGGGRPARHRHGDGHPSAGRSQHLDGSDGIMPMTE